MTGEGSVPRNRRETGTRVETKQQPEGEFPKNLAVHTEYIHNDLTEENKKDTMLYTQKQKNGSHEKIGFGYCYYDSLMDQIIKNVDNLQKDFFLFKSFNDLVNDLETRVAQLSDRFEKCYNEIMKIMETKNKQLTHEMNTVYDKIYELESRIQIIEIDRSPESY